MNDNERGPVRIGDLLTDCLARLGIDAVLVNGKYVLREDLDRQVEQQGEPHP
jgi:hypothetical protein